MIENLQDELYQLENKQTKTFLKMAQNFLQSNQTIFELDLLMIQMKIF